MMLNLNLIKPPPKQIRWAAPEVLEDGAFTLKSDVWSFGVLMWEIFTFGEKPYSDLKLNKDVRRRILSGGLLPQPAACPGDLYSMMVNCWDYVSWSLLFGGFFWFVCVLIFCLFSGGLCVYGY